MEKVNKFSTNNLLEKKEKLTKKLRKQRNWENSDFNEVA